jgi:hypothetical protein
MSGAYETAMAPPWRAQDINGFWSKRKRLQAGPEAASAPAKRQMAPKVPALSGSSSTTVRPRVVSNGLTSLTRKTRLRADVTMICLVRKSQAGLSS